MTEPNAFNPSPSDLGSDFPGANVILMGPSGTGKTHALHTLVETGLQVFCLFLEPGMETLIGVYADAGKPIPPNLHWHYLKPKSQGFAQLKSTADAIGKYDLAGLTKMKDMNRDKANQMTEIFTVLNDFVDQHTGKSYGPVDSWDTNCVLVIDSLSALNHIAMSMVVGTKPVKDKSDWGIAQQAILSMLMKLTSGCQCHFVLLAHVDREVDDVLGGVKLMVSALGKAITAQIPRDFSDVILTSRENANFYWDTASGMADVKTRNLPIQSKLPADFRPIIKKWAARKALADGGKLP